MKFIANYLWSLLCTCYLFTLGIFTPKYRKLIYTIANTFGLHTKTPVRFPQAPLGQFIDPNIPLTMAALTEQEGNISTHELAVLCSLIKQQACTHVFEFGTFTGRTTLNLALNLPDNGHVFTLDLDPASPHTALALAPYEHNFVQVPKATSFANHPASAKITCLTGDSATFDFTPYHNRINLVFIDASHAFHYVKSDTENAFKLLQNGKGFILWHDCGVWDGVTRYLNQASASDPRFLNLQHISNTSLALLHVNH